MNVIIYIISTCVNQCYMFQKDMDYIAENPGIFDHTIINDDLDKAYSELESALKPFCGTS